MRIDPFLLLALVACNGADPIVGTWRVVDIHPTVSLTTSASGATEGCLAIDEDLSGTLSITFEGGGVGGAELTVEKEGGGKYTMVFQDGTAPADCALSGDDLVCVTAPTEIDFTRGDCVVQPTGPSDPNTPTSPPTDTGTPSTGDGSFAVVTVADAAVAGGPASVTVALHSGGSLEDYAGALPAVAGTAFYGSCYFLPVPLPEVPTDPRLDAGEISVTVGVAPVALSVVGGVASGSIPAWPEGQTVAITATGGTFPAFSLDPLLVAPTALVPTAEPAAAAVDTDLVLGWSGSGGDVVTFDLIGEKASIRCTMDDTGSGTVPTQALAVVGPGAASARLARMARALPSAVDYRYYVAGTASAGASWAITLE